MTWSSNNVAHRLLWRFTRSIHWDFASQGNSMTSFKEGGEWNNSFVIDAATGAGAAILQGNAKVFATKFNKWIVDVKGADYEEGVNPSSAITKLTAAFALPGSRLNSCGDVVDEIYLCKGESS
ncbi:MAG: hypothetical protein ACI88H_002087 [Cocleimonas sp.]|jgi:hypothetical protein